jgi:hypothetical protein
LIDLDNENESFRSWQHLNLAGFLGFNMSGEGQGSGYAILGENVPGSSFSNAGYSLMYEFVERSGVTMSDNVITFGSVVTTSTSSEFITRLPMGAILSPSDAYLLDKKYDDGLPGAGKLTAAKGYNQVLSIIPTNICWNSGSPYYSYRAGDELECYLSFKIE